MDARLCTGVTVNAFHPTDNQETGRLGISTYPAHLSFWNDPPLAVYSLLLGNPHNIPVYVFVGGAMNP
jgi:hypothetical protein